MRSDGMLSTSVSRAICVLVSTRKRDREMTSEMVYLIGVFRDHLLDGHLDEGSGNAVAAVIFACC